MVIDCIRSIVDYPIAIEICKAYITWIDNSRIGRFDDLLCRSRINFRLILEKPLRNIPPDFAESLSFIITVGLVAISLQQTSFVFIAIYG
ncbi:hypothetical protein D3C80_780450 [compost metagenome]